MPPDLLPPSNMAGKIICNFSSLSWHFQYCSICIALKFQPRIYSHAFGVGLETTGQLVLHKSLEVPSSKADKSSVFEYLRLFNKFTSARGWKVTGGCRVKVKIRSTVLSWIVNQAGRAEGSSPSPCRKLLLHYQGCQLAWKSMKLLRYWKQEFDFTLINMRLRKKTT